MAIYLQVRAGALGILLDALRVHEVVLLGEGLREDQAFAEWRDQVLHVVRLASHLQLPGGGGQQAVVYSPGEGQSPVMLHVDEVERLRHLEPGHFKGMPRVPARTALLFDAVYSDQASSRELFRLRDRLEPALLGVHAQQVADGEDLSAPATT